MVAFQSQSINETRPEWRSDYRCQVQEAQEDDDVVALHAKEPYCLIGEFKAIEMRRL